MIDPPKKRLRIIFEYALENRSAKPTYQTIIQAIFTLLRWLSYLLKIKLYCLIDWKHSKILFPLCRRVNFFLEFLPQQYNNAPLGWVLPARRLVGDEPGGLVAEPRCFRTTRPRRCSLHLQKTRNRERLNSEWKTFRITVTFVDSHCIYRGVLLRGNLSASK